MDLTQLQDKLEIKNDINNLVGIKLLDKYGRTLSDSINFLKKLNILFIRESNYPLCITKEYNKLTNYLLIMENKYGSELIKSKTNNIREKLDKNIKDYKEIKKLNKISDETIAKEMEKTGNKYAPSLSIKTYSQMVNALYEECKTLNNVLKRDTMLPSVNETKEKFSKYYDYARNIDFVRSYKLLDELYQESPLLQFCFDEKYLLLANYILCSSIDKKIKDKIVNLTKDIINTSINIRHNDFFNGDVNLEEYNRLSKYTLENIREYEIRKVEEKEKTDYSVSVEENNFGPAIYTTIKKKIVKKVFK